MAELRSVDPRTLKPNPNNSRTIPVPKEMDLQLAASIAVIGLLQPPVVREIDGELVVRYGDRRTKAAIAAGKDIIDVYVLDGNESADFMASLVENLHRAGPNPVDIWRAIDKLEQQAWNEEAIANTLGLPVRTVKKLKLLGSLHPPMLDFMAKGSMPSEEHLRTIANAPLDDQAQVWKANRPKKGHDVSWWDVARALSKPRIPFSAAKFDDTLAEEYGVVWLEDLFAPAGEDGRYTTNADGFFGAQQAWMTASLPANGTVLPQDEHGRPELPKGAERIYGKPTKQDKIGHYLDPRSGEVKTIVYRLPEPKKSGKAAKGGATGSVADAESEVLVKLRPDVTQKGLAMIGDFRTEALHEALNDETISAETLVGLLVLALGANNVSVQSPLAFGRYDPEEICDRISEGGVLTADAAVLCAAARDMLKFVLSCRTNMSDSGISGRIAGETLGAATHLPSMATEAFLSCLSRQALERSAAAEGLKVEARVKDTRASLVKRCSGTTWHFPGALFPLTEEERVNAAPRNHWVSGNVDGTEQADRPGDNVKAAEGGDDEGYDQPGSDAPDDESQRFATAAE
ncbi:ParB N-terminal domain-containing protein [Acidisphaera sp. S103]|uniref:ParB N-terminal domain-containing protein n=1 Tax=Acidisphaera sp. S103 TaxID=1747223 RepID=UPI00131C9983|nr:ParB N-terminal domain-containing protein [Acidisphaera sp. S103]